MTRTIWLPLLVLGLALATGCSDDDNPTDPEGGGDPPLTGVGTVSGLVTLTGGFPSFHPIAVTAGSVTTTANEDGYFVLSQLPVGETLVGFSTSGRVSTFRIVDVTEGGHVHLPDVVLASRTSHSFDADDGGTATTLDGNGSVELPPGSIVTASGNAFHGTVFVSVTAMQPQAGDFYGAFPGRYDGVRNDASEVPFESFGFLAVELTDQFDNVLALAPGATAMLRLAVAGDWADMAPASLPIWHFDEAAGVWREDGTATLAGDVYTAGVTHLSTWTWARPVDDMCGVTGFVVNDSGQPAAGVRVISRGVDHRFVDETVTNADGLYTVSALPTAIADLWAMSGSLAGDELRVSVGDECPETAAENLVVTVPAYTIALTWGAEPPDLDSHLLIPMTWDDAYDYYHIAYYSLGFLGQHPYAQLDTDDTTAYGPEIITGTRVFSGRFQYWVHEFETDDTAELAASGAQVQLGLGGALYLFEVGDVPLEGADQDGWWHVFDIVISGGAIDIETVMRFQPRFSEDGVYVPDPAKRGK